MVQKKYSEKETSPNKQKKGERKERNTCGYRNACISKVDRTKGSGFNESIETKNEAKQNKRNTREKTQWHFLWLVNKGDIPGGSSF